MHEIEQLWDRITKQIQVRAPEIYSAIQPGASESTIRWAEKLHGVAFPEEVKTLYRLQNGVAGRWPEGAWQDPEELRAAHRLPKDPHNIIGLVDSWAIQSLEQMCLNWKCSKEEQGFPDPKKYLSMYFFPQGMEELPFLPLAWHPNWLHFMGDIFGSKYYIDLVPRSRDRVGQIICWPDLRRGELPWVIASNLQALLITLAQDLEAGAYTFDDSTGELWSQERFASLDENMLLYLRIMRRRGSKP